jgi:hypothetical protein
MKSFEILPARKRKKNTFFPHCFKIFASLQNFTRKKTNWTSLQRESIWVIRQGLTVNAHEKEIIKSEGSFSYRCGMDFSRFISAMGRNQSSLPTSYGRYCYKSKQNWCFALFEESGRKYEIMELSFSDFVWGGVTTVTFPSTDRHEWITCACYAYI